MLQVISRPHEEILKAVYRYRYMTALDVTYLLYSPKSITYVREVLSALCGGADYQYNHYLFRFPLPQFSSGRTEKIYTLGSLGRDLFIEMGYPVEWYFRPQKVKHLSYGFVIHSLVLTRFLVATTYFIKKRKDFKILKFYISYELEKEGLKKATTVIPDAWILFEEIGQTGNYSYPVLVEIDRGTEFKKQFQEHVRSRVEFIRSGAYSALFDTTAVLVAYITTGQLPEYQRSRRVTMCHWTLELLKEMKLEKWITIFRFCGFDWNTLFDSPLIFEPVWYLPDKDKPQTLFIQ